MKFAVPGSRSGARRRATRSAAIVAMCFGSMLASAGARQDPPGQADPSAPTPPSPAMIAQNTPDPMIKELVGRLDLETYKATIKGLTQFGDRRQGTQRNR